MLSANRSDLFSDCSVSLQFWDYTVTVGPNRLSNHAHHYWQMNLADSGEADFYCGNEKFRMTPWNILIIPPECRHEIVYLPGVSFGCFSFKFHLRALKDNIFKPLFLGESRETRVYINIIQTLVRELAPPLPPGEVRRDVPVTSEDDYATILEPLLSALLIRYYRSCNNQLTLTGRLRQFLIQNNGRPLSVDDAAAHFCYSAGHFSVLIKNESGMGAKQFIDRERMRIACNYLEFTQMNASEVAAFMGFPDVLTFCHFFKRQCGTSPAVFRREIQGTNKSKKRENSGE